MVIKKKDPLLHPMHIINFRENKNHGHGHKLQEGEFQINQGHEN